MVCAEAACGRQPTPKPHPHSPQQDDSWFTNGKIATVVTQNRTMEHNDSMPDSRTKAVKHLVQLFNKDWCQYCITLPLILSGQPISELGKIIDTYTRFSRFMQEMHSKMGAQSKTAFDNCLPSCAYTSHKHCPMFDRVTACDWIQTVYCTANYG